MPCTKLSKEPLRSRLRLSNAARSAASSANDARTASFTMSEMD